jgi:hypothetical protein
MKAHSLALCLLLTPALAQKPTFTWQKQTSTFDYQAVAASGHTLNDFKLHQFWMMGANRTSIWRLTMPVLIGDDVIAPGAYPILMKRTAEAASTLQVKGTGKALGAPEDLEMEGPIGKLEKTAPKLVIGCEAEGDARQGNRPVNIVVLFGANDWRVAATFVGNEVKKVGPWTLTAWSLTAAAFAARDRKAVPVAMLTKGKEAWNLVLGRDRATLIPVPRAEGQVVIAPEIDESRIVVGTVEAITSQDDAVSEVVKLLAADVDKGRLVVGLGCRDGAVLVHCELPGPKK